MPSTSEQSFLAKCICGHIRNVHFANAGKCSLKEKTIEGSTKFPFTKVVQEGCLKLCQRFEYDDDN